MIQDIRPGRELPRANDNETWPLATVGGGQVAARRSISRFQTVAIMLVVAGLLAGVTVYVYALQKPAAKPVPKKPAVAKSNQPKQTAPASTPPLGQSLADSFESQAATIIARYPNVQIGVSLYDETNSWAATAGSAARMTAASTAKLITTAAYIHQVEDGKRTLTTDIAGLPAQERLRLMLVNSDNDSWNLMNTNLNVENVEAYAGQFLGIEGYDRPSNLLSAAEINNILVKLYSGKLMNADHSQLVLGYMAQANYRQFIRAAVPAGYTVYHKAGIYAGNVHDAAIIVRNSDQKALILTVFTYSADPESSATVRTAVFHDLTAAALSVYFGS
jgi:beta-lactamase class A